MRPIDFFVYYCMQKFKTGNRDYSSPLGRACGAVGFTIGCFIVLFIEVTLDIVKGYKLMDHQYPFILTFAAVNLGMGAAVYYVYSNRKRYQYIKSSQYKPFRLTDTVGFTMTIVALTLSLIFMFAGSIYVADYIH
jgi:hypothetical protein